MRACGSDSHPARQHLAPISRGTTKNHGSFTTECSLGLGLFTGPPAREGGHLITLRGGGDEGARGGRGGDQL